MKKQRIRVKIEKQKDFKPVIRWEREKYWVTTSYGVYFYTIKCDDGTWTHCDSHKRHPTMRAAIAEWLEMERLARIQRRKEYRKIRRKEMVFSVLPGI